MIRRALIGRRWTVTRIDCDHMACDAALDLEPSVPQSELRAAAAAAGWQITTYPNVMVLCPRHRRGQRTCAVCPGGELFDLIGHDMTGHRVARALYRVGLTTADQVATTSDAELQSLPNFGEVCVRRVREAIRNRRAD